MTRRTRPAKDDDPRGWPTLPADVQAALAGVVQPWVPAPRAARLGDGLAEDVAWRRPLCADWPRQERARRAHAARVGRAAHRLVTALRRAAADPDLGRYLSAEDWAAVDCLHDSADVLAHMRPLRGKPVNVPRLWFEHDVADRLARAGVPVSATRDGPLARVLALLLPLIGVAAPQEDAMHRRTRAVRRGARKRPQ